MEKQLDEKMSLNIILEAIENSKSKFRDNGFFYLLWGWLVLVASLLQFGLLRFTTTEYNWVGWPVLMISGAIISTIYGYRLGKKSTVLTFIDLAMIYLWYGFLIAITIIITMAVMGKMPFSLMNPLIIVLYGLGTFVSGGLLKFKPLVIGAIAAWIIAVVSFFIQSDIQLLLMGIAIVVAYLVPGYMLKSRNGSHV